MSSDSMREEARREEQADEVGALLVDRTDPPVACAVNVGEVDRLARVGSVELNDVLHRIVWLRDGGLQVVPTDAFDGAAAGAFRSRYYERSERPISFADCTALAAGFRYDQRLATLDKALAATARLLDIEVVALPNSAGERP